eukprot:SAG22_NODE_8189_length_675_cov_0.736568_1_plen_177_part_01
MAASTGSADCPVQLLPAHVVPPLSTAQLAHFAREGYLVLPRARDSMWATLRAECPRFRRGDPASWTSFSEAELRAGAANKARPSGFSVYNEQQFHIRCGADELFLDLFPRAMFPVAQQLLGAGTVAWPGGVDRTAAPSGGAAGGTATAEGLCRGPVFLDRVHWAQGLGQTDAGAADR